MALSVLFHHRLLLDIIRPPDVTDDEKDSSEISAQDPQKAKKNFKKITPLSAPRSQFLQPH